MEIIQNENGKYDYLNDMIYNHIKSESLEKDQHFSLLITKDECNHIQHDFDSNIAIVTKNSDILYEINIFDNTRYFIPYIESPRNTVLIDYVQLNVVYNNDDTILIENIIPMININNIISKCVLPIDNSIEILKYTNKKFKDKIELAKYQLKINSIVKYDGYYYDMNEFELNERNTVCFYDGNSIILETYDCPNSDTLDIGHIRKINITHTERIIRNYWLNKCYKKE